jgi:hypothetical protein
LGRCQWHSFCNTDANHSTNCNAAQPNADIHTDGDSNRYLDACCYTNSNTDNRCDRNTHRHTDGNAHCRTDRDTYSYTNGNAWLYTADNTYCYTYRHSDACRYTASNTVCDSFGNTDRDAVYHTECDANRNAVGHSFRYTKPNAFCFPTTAD